MFGSDIALYVTRFERVRPTGRGTSVVAKLMLRARGTESGGQIRSYGYYHGGIWVPTKEFRSDMARMPDGSVTPMWKTNITTSNMVLIPATIRMNSEDGSVFAKLDQSSYQTNGVWQYHYRHLLLDRNGSLENIAIESMLAALYKIMDGKFESYDPRSYHGNVTCAHCKSHVYVSPRETGEFEEPLLPTKSVTDLREVGPAAPLHFCVAKRDFVDEDCANRFNVGFKLSPQFYTNEWGQTLTLGSTKMLTYKPGTITIRLGTQMEEPVDEEVDPSVDPADDGEVDAFDEENIDGESGRTRDPMYANIGNSYIVLDEESEKEYKKSQDQLDEELFQIINEQEYRDRAEKIEGEKTLWCSIKGCRSMFEKPNLTNAFVEVVAKAYAIDYNDYTAAELYSIAGDCPHYCSSYKKGSKWINVIYPDRVTVMHRGRELKDREINQLAACRKAFKVLLSKSELIYALKG